MTDQQKGKWNDWLNSWKADLLKPQTIVFVALLLWNGLKGTYNTANHMYGVYQKVERTALSDSALHFKLDTFILAQQIWNRQRDYRIEQLRGKCGIDWTVSTQPHTDHCLVMREALVAIVDERKMSLN